MNDWAHLTWGQLGSLLYGKALRGYQGHDGPVRVFGTNGSIGWTDEALFPPGVIVGRKGAYRGIHFAPGPCWVIDTAFWLEIDSRRVDVKWAFWQLRTVDLNSIDSGSAIPSTSRDAFAQIPVSLPPLPDQRKVVAVLDSIEDLIENNRRRVELLEEMARTIYREWFVRFLYPGHEGVPLVDSLVGPIPDGWAVRTLGELSINYDRRRRPLSKAQRGERRGAVPYYGAAKLIDWVDGWIFDGEYLLFAEDGSVQTPDGFPVLQLVEGRFWANNHTHILEGSTVSTRFLYLASAVQPITGYVTGAAQPKITQANLNRIPLVVGPPELHQEFDRTVDPLFDEWRLLQQSIAPLAGLRDLLLPKLVTGQIDVSHLDLDGLTEAATA